MALIKPFRDEGTVADLLLAATEQYADAIETLRILKAQLKGGGQVAPIEISRAAADLRKATQTLFDERKRLEDKRRKEAGIVNDFGLDFAQVRDEVGRSLDRLRAARGSGEIPE